MKLLWTLLALGATLLLCWPARGQDRYELGRRLRRFERELEVAPAPARARAMPEVQRAVMAFFMQQARGAARSLDAARFALGSPPSPEEEWAAGLGWSDPGRALDPRGGELRLGLARAYEPSGVAPPGWTLAWEVLAHDGRSLARGEATGGQAPPQLTLPADLPEGDLLVRCEVASGGRVLARLERGLSLVADLATRLERAERACAQLDARLPWEERAGVAHKLALVRGLLPGGGAVETDLPAARLLADAERALQALARGAPFHAGREGEDWLRLGGPQRSAAVRLLVPPAGGAPPPLVVALHGMGGSENMFFDAYGAGAIAHHCRQRGWMLLAPRAGGPPLGELLDSLAGLHAYDRRRVLLVGHSMGAMQASLALGQEPGRYAAAAFLAGGGRVGGAGPLPPCFVGTGAHDFAAGGARGLARALERRAAALEVREYPAEHLTVVQLALPDVFAHFEAALQAAPRPPASPRYGPIRDEASPGGL